MRRAYPITLAGLLAAIFGLNTWVDLAGTRSPALVADLAAAQGADDILVSETDFDQRAWVRGRLRRGCPDRVIAGSSTVGGFTASMFGDGTLLNVWLTGPTLEDYEALVVLLEDAACKPKEIILGVDPWLLDRAQRNDRWLTLYWEVVRYRGGRLGPADLFGPAVRWWATVKERLSFVTTIESARWAWSHRGGKGAALPHLVPAPVDAACASANAELRVRYADGHFIGCPRWALDDTGVEAVARAYVRGDPHGVVRAAAPDDATFGRLRAVAARLVGRGSRVLLLAPPYHPVTFAALTAQMGPRLASLDDNLGRLAVAAGARFVSLRDPAKVGCAASELSDSHHAKPACLQREATRLVQELAAP